MASPRNEHCANCIGTLSFPMYIYIAFLYSSVHVKRTNLDSLAARNTKDSVRHASTSLQSTDHSNSAV